MPPKGTGPCTILLVASSKLETGKFVTTLWYHVNHFCLLTGFCKAVVTAHDSKDVSFITKLIGK